MTELGYRGAPLLETSVLLFLVTVVPTGAASTPLAEGELLHFRQEEELAWQLAAEEYVLVVRAGSSGATLDLGDMRITSNPNTVRNLPAGTGFTDGVQFDGNETKSLRVLDGTGSLIMARKELVRGLPTNGAASHLKADAHVPSGGCKAYLVDPLFMREPYQINAEGSGTEFRVFNRLLVVVDQSLGRLSVVQDPQVFESSQLIIQACNLGQIATVSSIELLYPASNIEPEAAGTNATNIGGLLGALAVVASAWIRRR